MRIKVRRHHSRITRKSIFKLAKGNYSAKRTRWRMVKQQVEASLNRGLHGPQGQEGRLPLPLDRAHQRRLPREGLSYSRFIAGLKKAGSRSTARCSPRWPSATARSFKQLVALAQRLLRLAMAADTTAQHGRQAYARASSRPCARRFPPQSRTCAELAKPSASVSSGASGKLTELLKRLKDLAIDDKRELGPKASGLKAGYEAELDAAKDRPQKDSDARGALRRRDSTSRLPALRPPRGRRTR